MKSLLFGSVSLLAALLVGCGGTSAPPTTATTTSAAPAAVAVPPVATTAPAAAPTPAPRSVNFVELQAGDCVTDLPPSDLSSVSVNVVDCGAPHLAQVFARRDIEVNAAVNDVASRACAAGFSQYTGHPDNGSYSITYLIDSNQDRTSNNPLPSTVICLAQAADGSALRGPIGR